MSGPVSGRMDRASVAETIHSGSISVRAKLNIKKLTFTAALVDVQHLKETV